MYFKCSSFFYLLLGRSTIYTSCVRPRDENSKANCCHKRLSETKTEMKKNLEEVALFYALASTIIHSSVYCFPFHTHLSSNLDALGQGGGGCWGSTLALRIWNRLGAQSGSQWMMETGWMGWNLLLSNCPCWNCDFLWEFCHIFYHYPYVLLCNLPF